MKPIKISRSKAIALLGRNAQEAIDKGLSMGHIFGATWVTAGSGDKPPRVVHESLRLDVHKYLKGQGGKFGPDQQGYLSVFMMMNEKRALALYTGNAARRLKKLEPALKVAITKEESCIEAVRDASAAAETARFNLQETEKKAFHTKKERRDSERPLKAKHRQALRELKKCEAERDKAVKLVGQLQQQVEFEKIKKNEPETARRRELAQRVERLEKKLRVTADAAQRGRLQQSIDKDQMWMANPIESLLANYRKLNVRGLLSLRIDGKEYEVTTPPVPPIPSGYVAKVTADDTSETSNEDPKLDDCAPQDRHCFDPRKH